MRWSTALTVLASLSSSSLFAAATPRGSIVIIGTGEASSPPEFMNLSVTVTSICYDSSRAAKDANAALAQQLLALLKGFQRDQRDKLTAHPGPNQRVTETAYVNNATRVLCENKWRSSNVLTLNTASIDALADLQDALLGTIDAATIDPARTTQTFANLSAPSFQIYADTQHRLRAEAQGKAYEDARSQFQVFAGRCMLQDVQLASIAPPNYGTALRRENASVAEDYGSRTPVIPDEIVVQAAWEFQWTFTAPAGCPR